MPQQDSGAFTSYVTDGRGYPDVSMAGHNFQFISGGVEHIISSTSASVAVVAGMVSLVNAERISNGYTTVGYMNTALYTTNVSFTTDITSGKNNCPADDVDVNGNTTPVACCSEGYNATTGWDPLSGID